MFYSTLTIIIYELFKNLFITVIKSITFITAQISNKSKSIDRQQNVNYCSTINPSHAGTS